MAASVRIEDEAFSDLRFGVLATACLLADADHARGKMAVLWRQCTAQGSYVLPVSVVASVLGPNGVDALAESTLGERVDGGIRIAGTRGRIEWLRKLRKNAQKGGKAKAAKRQTRGKQEAAKTAPPPFPPIPALIPSPAPSPAPVSLPPGEESTSPSARVPSGPHQEAIAAFDGYYRRAHGGSKPTWPGSGVKLMGALVKAHGVAEIARRLHNLETAPPDFPPPPWDMRTFSQNFDRIAQPSRGRETALDVALRMAANGGEA